MTAYPSGSKRSLLQKEFAGSPPPSEPVFLAVGKLGRPHGVHGEVVLHVLTDFPERLHSGAEVYLGAKRTSTKIKNTRQHRDKLLVAFEGVFDRTQADVFRNQMVFVPAADVPPLPEGEYYYHELLGLQVVTDQGQMLGTLKEIIETGANDVYVVRPEKGQDVLLPAIDDVILDIDLEEGVIETHLLPGILTDKPEK